MKMYNPCLECQIRYGHDYTEECDAKCQYAYAIKEHKIKIAKLAPCGFDDRLKCSLCGYIITDTEELRLNPEFHKYCGHCGAKFEED
jgi:hypothetical protein